MNTHNSKSFILSIYFNGLLLPVHLQRALATIKDARKKQNSHHFPNIYFQVTLSLLLQSLRPKHPNETIKQLSLIFPPAFVHLHLILPDKSNWFNYWRRCRDGAVVRALASHQCGPGSIPRSGVKCGLSLLVLYSAPRGFLRVLRFPLPSKNKIWLDCVNC